MTFTELYTLWFDLKKQEVRSSTASNYATAWFSVKDFVADIDISTFDRWKAQETLNKLTEKGLSAKSSRDRMAVLKMMLQYANQVLMITVKPLDWKLRYPAKRQKLIKSFGLNEAKHLIRQVHREILTGKTTSIPIAISLLTGLRIGEVSGLRWEDFDFAHKTFVVQRTVNHFYDPTEAKMRSIIGPPKTAAGFREVPLHPTLARLLRLAYGNPSKNKGFVLTGTETPRQVHNIRDAYDRFLLRNKLSKINFHGLRHTFATILIEAGVDVKTVSDILGHANVSTTFNLYVHPSADAKKKAVLKAFRGFKIEENQ